MSNELLEKVVTTTGTNGVDAAGGGLLTKEQSDRFIDYMWDKTVILNDARTERMRSNTKEIDKIAVGAKLARLATEAVDDGVNAHPTFSKVSLTTKKLRLDFEMSTESLEDNIEQGGLEDHIVQLMATAFGNDVEDLVINGSTALTGDALYKAFDGYRIQALAGGWVKSNGGATVSKGTFNTGLKALPRVYKQRRNELKFYTGSNIIQDYLYSLTTIGTGGTPEDIAASILRGNPSGPQGPAGGAVIPFAFGIPVVEVPLFREDLNGDYSGATGSHSYAELTFPKNRIVGIKREVTVHRQFQPKKDTTEYTVFIRVGVAIENLDAYVVVKDIKVAS
jgi:hypothetical protein